MPYSAGDVSSVWLYKVSSTGRASLVETKHPSSPLGAPVIRHAIHHSSGSHPSDFVFLLSSSPLFTFLCTLNTLNNRSTAGQAVQVPVSATARATASLPPGHLPATHHPPTLTMSVPHPSTSCTLARYRYVSHLPPSRRLRMRSPPFASARKTSTVEGFQVVSGPGVCCHGSAQVESSRVKQSRCIALLPIHLLPSHP